MATAPLSNLTATWNAGGTTFNAIKMNVTDTASAAGSLLLNLQVGGVSRFSVSKMSGTRSIEFDPFGQLLVSNITGGGLRWEGNNGFDIGVGGGRIQIPDFWPIEWRSGAAMSAATDLAICRDAANTLAQRRSTNAQAHRWYRSFTDVSNYSRIYLGWSSSTAILATEGAGTGARGNIAFGTAALATSATVGYVMIPSSNGAPTGVPADIPTGQVALHYDTANNKIYVYNGGWVSTAALT